MTDYKKMTVESQNQERRNHLVRSAAERLYWDGYVIAYDLPQWAESREDAQEFASNIRKEFYKTWDPMDCFQVTLSIHMIQLSLDKTIYITHMNTTPANKPPILSGDQILQK